MKSSTGDKYQAFVLLFAVFFHLFTVSPFAKELSVVLSGETHAMLFPDENSGDMGGGLAQRASVLNSIAEECEMLLLDAGGFSAGSIYDLFTQGRHNDSLRTIKTIQAMGEMGYDAVGIGDDDLQYGGKWLVARANEADLPLISANCFLPDGSYLTNPFTVITKGQLKFGITAVTTTERLFSIDESVQIADPITSLAKIWDELEGTSDYQIIISHLGEQESAELVTRFPNTFVIANGHRKTAPAPSFTAGTTSVLQFGFQGKALSALYFKMKESGLSPVRSDWIPIPGGTESDRDVAQILGALSSARERVYDLYLMSKCPYGIDALREFMTFVDKSGVNNWKLWFVGTITDENELRSSGGEAEIEEEMMWLGVERLYPERYKEFLTKRSVSFKPTRVLIKDMGFDSEKIGIWIQREGKENLKKHYYRSERLNISSSPTLFVNNYPYMGEVLADYLLMHECSEQPASVFCDSVPECLDDSDCFSPGMIGKCVSDKDKGICEYIEDISFEVSVVVADSSFSKPEDDLIANVKELFPAAEVEKVLWNSPAGKKIMDSYAPKGLPFFVFDTIIREAYNFKEVEESFIEKNGTLLFKDEIVKKNFFPERKPSGGMVELFVDPLMSGLKRILSDIDGPLLAGKITINPLIYGDCKENSLSSEEKLRFLEARRWLVLSAGFSSKFTEYLRLYSKNLDRDAALDSLGIADEELRTVMQENGEFFSAYCQSISGFDFGGPVQITVDNRHVIEIRHHGELLHFLGILSN